MAMVNYLLTSGESSVGSCGGVFPSVGQTAGFKPTRHALFLWRQIEGIKKHFPFKDIPPVFPFPFILSENPITEHINSLKPIVFLRRLVENIQGHLGGQSIPQLLLDVAVELSNLARCLSAVQCKNHPCSGLLKGYVV